MKDDREDKYLQTTQELDLLKRLRLKDEQNIKRLDASCSFWLNGPIELQSVHLITTLRTVTGSEQIQREGNMNVCATVSDSNSMQAEPAIG